MSRFFTRFVHYSPKDDAGGAGSDAALERESESLRQGADRDDNDAGSGSEAEPSIAEAGRQWLAGMSTEERERELDDDDERPTPAEAVTDIDGDEELGDEPITRDEDGAEWNPDAERWVLDGKFVAGEKPEGWVKPAKPAAAAPAADAAAAPKDGKGKAAQEPKAVKVTLRGEADRAEEDIEVEVDEELAARIKRLQNGSMRRQQYNQRKAELDARQSDMDAVDIELEQDPVGFIINQVSPARRIEVARALLVEHLDELRPDLEKYLDDDSVRLREQVTLRDRMSESQKQLDRAKQTRAYAKQCMDAAAKLVPEDAEDEVVDEFLADARRILHEAAKAGTRITPETVKDLLARRVKLYGFDQTRRSTTAPRREATREVREDTRTARPVTDRARQVAERRTPTKAEAAAAQSRIRRVQQARHAGSRVAPAGAGAAPVQVPVLKPEEESDVRSASKAIRQKLPDSWTSAQR